MARDLHDNLGQVMSYANLQTQAIKQEIKNQNLLLADKHLNDLTDNLKTGHQDIRHYIYDNRKSSILRKSFIELVNEELNIFEKNTGIAASLIVNEEITISIQENEHRVHLIYILREALNNIIKHASASRVEISFKKKKDYIEIVIKDNGKGFSDQFQGKKKGSGLAIMEERIRYMEGSLKIEPADKQGTRLIINMPL